MKTTIITRMALVFGISLISMAAAAGTTPGNTVTPSPEKTISSYFKFPKVLIPYSAAPASKPVKVEVIFTTGKDGKVNYAYAKTRDLKLKKEIERQLSTYKISQLQENVAHRVVLNFKYLDSNN
jgi:hypothetical protein